MEKQNIHAGHRERLRQQYRTNGITNLNDINYLEALLTFAVPRADTNITAHNLIEAFGSIDNIFNAAFSQLIKVNGVGKHTADLITLVDASEFFKNKSKVGRHPSIKTLSQCISFLHLILPHSRNEQFVAIALRKNLTVENYKIFKGYSHSKISIDAEDLINFLVTNQSGFFMFAHTHPYHNAKPSESDAKQFSNLLAMSTSLNFQIIDNLILGDDEFFSFKLSKIYKYNEVDIDYGKIGGSIAVIQQDDKNGFLNNVEKMREIAYNDNESLNTFSNEITTPSFSKKRQKTEQKTISKTEAKNNIEKDCSDVWQPIQENNYTQKLNIDNDNYTMEDFKKMYKNKPHFNSLDEQKAWLKKYCDDFIRANKNNNRL